MVSSQLSPLSRAYTQPSACCNIFHAHAQQRFLTVRALYHLLYRNAHICELLFQKGKFRLRQPVQFDDLLLLVQIRQPDSVSRSLRS